MATAESENPLRQDMMYSGVGEAAVHSELGQQHEGAYAGGAGGVVLALAKPPMTRAQYCGCCCCTLFPAVIFPFLLIVGFTASSQAASSVATVATVQRLGTIDPLAVCNDGTEGAYYFARSTDDAKARRWLVWLDGGDFCESERECAGRPAGAPAFYKTTTGVPEEKHLSGLMSSDAPTFGGANIASVHYCSSDQHTGDRAASKETWGLHFRGQRIVKAVLADLATPAKGLRSGDQLTLAGCSAGSNGAEQLCDFVSGWVPEGIAVSCIFDSPLSAIDVPTLDGAWAPRVPVGESQLITVSGKVGDPARPSTVDLWNTTGVLSPACVASRASKDYLWQCNWAQFTLKFHTSKPDTCFVVFWHFSDQLCLCWQRPIL
jgi:hypothetical protein